MTPTVTVVTPWFNHPELAKDYWTAMRSANARVLVIDNASSPPLPNAVRLDRNTGFCYANNVGLDLARTDAVAFVNNDVYATSIDWLDTLTSRLEPGVLVGAQLRTDVHANVDGHPMPYLDGWCVVGMRQDLLNLGGWDDTLVEPAYYSDNLLSLEARAAGMVLREARCGLVHKLNGSTPPDAPGVREATTVNQRTYVNRARELLQVAA